VSGVGVRARPVLWLKAAAQPRGSAPRRDEQYELDHEDTEAEVEEDFRAAPRAASRPQSAAVDADRSGLGRIDEQNVEPAARECLHARRAVDGRSVRGLCAGPYLKLKRHLFDLIVEHR
jgi:hypothetical protein